MKQLKWINLLLICTIYFSACQKNDLNNLETKTSDPNLYAITFNGQDVQVLKKGNFYYFYDDVAFEQKDFDSLRNLYWGSRTRPRAAYDYTYWKVWPNSVILYKIDVNFDYWEKQNIYNAISHIQTNTAAIRFFEAP